jgi:hypothetical protein
MRPLPHRDILINQQGGNPPATNETTNNVGAYQIAGKEGGKMTTLSLTRTQTAKLVVAVSRVRMGGLSPANPWR